MIVICSFVHLFCAFVFFLTVLSDACDCLFFFNIVSFCSVYLLYLFLFFVIVCFLFDHVTFFCFLFDWLMIWLIWFVSQMCHFCSFFSMLEHIYFNVFSFFFFWIICNKKYLCPLSKKQRLICLCVLIFLFYYYYCWFMNVLENQEKNLQMKEKINIFSSLFILFFKIVLFCFILFYSIFRLYCFQCCVVKNFVCLFFFFFACFVRKKSRLNNVCRYDWVMWKLFSMRLICFYD